MSRRTPAAPGYRPPAGVRFAAGICQGCGKPYTLDRAAQPWARARTCSPRCAKILANRDRTPSTCDHCSMVESWRLTVDAHLQHHDTAARDEDARPPTFREWLESWQYQTADETAA